MTNTTRTINGLTITMIRDTGSHRSGGLDVHYDTIVKVLGEPNCTDLDDPYKVKAAWGFQDDQGRRGFIWSYKVDDPTDCESWSIHGPADLFDAIFSEPAD